MADLAVIVVSANSGRWLRRCLTTVYARAGGADLDVVVVDAACTDETAAAVAEFPQARRLAAENRGFAYGNNRAFLTTTAPYVLFLNPDTEILTGSFAALLAELDERPEVGLAGVRQLTPDGELWPTIRRFPSPLRHLLESLGSEHLPIRAGWVGERELDLTAYDRETSCDWTSGSFMLARREAVLAAGLMDERFFIYCEEPDLCLRMVRAGWQIRHLPSMTILHHAGRTGYAPRFIAQEAYARRQYMEKHFPPLRRWAAIAAYALGYALRASVGGRRRALAAEQRRASRAALAVLLRNGPPPFAAPPRQALAPELSPGRRPGP
jgi:N-acetylglucosaminyl-diphospho-decaprenol L-rhamnosyltransferase